MVPIVMCMAALAASSALVGFGAQCSGGGGRSMRFLLLSATSDFNSAPQPTLWPAIASRLPAMDITARRYSA